MPDDPTKIPLPGTISVNSVPEGVPVKLDGKDTGDKTPVTFKDVVAGSHIVTVTMPDDSLITREVTLSPGTAVSVILKKYSEEEKQGILYVGLYTISLIVVFSIIAILNRVYSPEIEDLLQMVIYIACSGGLGALAFSLYGFIKHLEKNDFSMNFTNSYYYRPLLGIIYGTFAFLFVAGGLMTLSGVPLQTSLFTTKTVMFYCALSFLAGFAEESFSVQLRELSEAVFKKKDSK